MLANISNAGARVTKNTDVQQDFLLLNCLLKAYGIWEENFQKHSNNMAIKLKILSQHSVLSLRFSTMLWKFSRCANKENNSNKT